MKITKEFIADWDEPACNSSISLYKTKTHFFLYYWTDGKAVKYNTIIKRDKHALGTIQEIVEAMKEDLAYDEED